MQLVAKIRPLFIFYGGDYMDDGSNDEWREWLDEWQYTISSDNRMYPIVPQHGNHENDMVDMVQRIFNIDSTLVTGGCPGTDAGDAYATLGFGGGQFRVGAPTTELEPGSGHGATISASPRCGK